MSDLIIRISGDASKFEDELERIKKQTEGLEGSLASVAKVSAVAWAALTAEVGLAVHAYAESEVALRKLTQAMQNQGVFTVELREKYKAWAEAVQAKTGIDDDAVIAGQAVLQSMIGQIPITEEMTRAAVELGEATGSTEGGFRGLAVAINGNAKLLRQYGIEIDENASKQERTRLIVEGLNRALGGQAEAANQGLGSLRSLQTAFGNLQEEIGRRLAPVVTRIIQGMTDFFNQLKDNKPLLDLIVSVGAGAAAMAAMGTFVGVAGLAFLKLRAALLAAQIATSAMGIAVKGLIGATGIGLLVIIASEVYLNWSTVWPRAQAIFAGFATSVSGIGAGLAGVLSGLIHFDLGKVKASLAQMKDALKQGFAEATKDLPSLVAPETKEEQDTGKKKSADAAAARLAEEENRKAAIRKAANELIQLEIEKASAAEINLKKQEIDTLEKLADEKYRGERDQLEEHLGLVRFLEEQAASTSAEQKRIFEEELLASNEEFQALTVEQKAAFLAQNQQALEAEIQTRQTTEEAAVKNRIKIQTTEHNEFLKNQLQFGRAYAEINRLMHLEAVVGAAKAFGELAQLQSSSNSTLKAIGKVAAVANITIKTAESAMNIYAGFSTIPIIGPALGVAGAAAAIAFGAEQVGRVTAAQEGGLLSGGIPGVDSIPVLAQQGELVAPSQSFEEVIGSVRAAREAQRILGDGGGLPVGGGGGGGGPVEVVLSLKDGLMEMIEAQLVERQNLRISIQGA